MIDAGVTSLVRDRELESRRIREATTIERRWYGPENRIVTYADADRAIAEGRLVHVPFGQPVYDLTRSEVKYESKQLNLLTPLAKKLLDEVMRKWGETRGERWPEVRLAVTSLWRPGEMQAKLARSSYWAVGEGESSHVAGAAFDVSRRSMWIGSEGVRSWDETRTRFDVEVFGKMDEILERVAHEGKANVVVERLIDEDRIVPSVSHVCVNPNYES